jgi:hypothetical protein
MKGNSVAMIVDGTDGTAINDFKGSSASKIGDGYIEVTLQGGPPAGKQDDPYVAAVLAQVVSHNGQSNPVPEKGADQNGEDGILRFGDGSKLIVQSVSVPVDPTHWTKANKGDVSVRLTFAEAARWIQGSIEKKLSIVSHDRPQILLALDTRHCGPIAQPAILESLHVQFGSAARYGFAQIWLAGPVPSRCLRIA